VQGPGLAVPSEDFERRPYIANLAVSPAFRRRGVAEKLMAYGDFAVVCMDVVYMYTLAYTYIFI